MNQSSSELEWRGLLASPSAHRATSTAYLEAGHRYEGKASMASKTQSREPADRWMTSSMVHGSKLRHTNNRIYSVQQQKDTHRPAAHQRLETRKTLDRTGGLTPFMSRGTSVERGTMTLLAPGVSAQPLYSREALAANVEDVSHPRRSSSAARVDSDPFPMPKESHHFEPGTLEVGPSYADAKEIRAPRYGGGHEDEDTRDNFEDGVGGLNLLPGIGAGEKEVQAPRYGGGHDEMDTIDNFETGTLVPIATACLPEVISYDNDEPISSPANLGPSLIPHGDALENGIGTKAAKGTQHSTARKAQQKAFKEGQARRLTPMAPGMPQIPSYSDRRKQRQRSRKIIQNNRDHIARVARDYGGQ